MPGTIELPLLPDEAVILGPRLAVIETPEQLIFVNASGPLMSCARDDATAKRYLGAVLMSHDLAKSEDLANVLGIHRATLFRNKKLYQNGGLDAIRDDRGRGAPRCAHKLTDEVLPIAQACLDRGDSQSQTARELKVSEATIRHAIKTGRLQHGNPKRSRRAMHSPRERAKRDAAQVQGAGTAVKRMQERALARQGDITEALPQFAPVEGVANLGVLLALPAILGEGILDAAKQVYAPLKSGFYGLQSILLCLVLMALLRIKNAECLSARQPGEMGILLGLDRVPEVKTLRSKLAELGEQQHAAQLAATLTAQWAQKEPDELGTLYIDGHVRAYTGRKHPLPKTFVQKRRQCVPAATDVWVHNEAAEPLFLVTSPINEHLLTMIEQEVIPQARAQISSARRLTIVFDREAWSPKTFQRWQRQGIDVITYRKGKQTPWEQDDFRPVTIIQDDKPVVYLLAERSVQVISATKKRPAFWMREIRRLCTNGHQTAILTTRQDLSAEVIAKRMFARWRQENFFKYMQTEFSIDHLSTYATKPADGERMVPNPARRALEKIRTIKKHQLGTALARQAAQQRDEVAPDKQENSIELVKNLTTQCDALSAQIASIEKRVPLNTLYAPDKLVHHESERKTITQLIKIVAYRSERCLASLIEPFFARHDEEVYTLLKSIFCLPGDLIPNEELQELHVRLYSLANRRSQQALVALCEMLNAQRIKYPGTNLRIVYNTIQSH